MAKKRGRKKKNEDGTTHVDLTDPGHEGMTAEEIDLLAEDFVAGNITTNENKRIRKELESNFIKAVGGKSDFVTGKLFELIDGIYVIDNKNSKEGDIKYYQRPPSLAAIKLALEMSIGKATARSEHHEEKTGLVTVEHIIKGMASPQLTGGSQSDDNDKQDIIDVS